MSTTEEAASDAGEVTLEEAFARAQELHRAGEVFLAHAIYERILAVVPDHVDALHFMGMAEFQMGRSERAADLIESALRLHPDYADARNNLGNIYRRRGELGRAREEYERVLERRPSDPDVLNNLGTILRAERRLDEALLQFERVVELDPMHADAHHNRGNVLFALKRTSEALDSFRQALMIRPYDRRSYQRLGMGYYVSGRRAEAHDVYRRWLEVMPDDAEARHMCAAYDQENVPDRVSKEAVKLVFDDFAENFDQVLDRLDYRAPSLIAEALEAILGPPEPRGVVLDAGCGTGLGGPLLRPYANRLVGIDLSDRMIEFAVRRGTYDAFVVGDLVSHLNRHPNTYDVMASIDTLVYFGDLKPVVDGISIALRSGGHAVFTLERDEPDSERNAFRLNPHGRYSHTEAYVKGLFESSVLRVVLFRRAVLRTELDKPVEGYVVAVRHDGQT